MGELADEADDAGEGEDGDERPSRSARKRHAEALQRLGVRLLELKPIQLARLELPPSLLQAVLETRRLRRGPALARARQYIGKLMREVDPVPIERALAELLPSRPEGARRARRAKPGRVTF